LHLVDNLLEEKIMAGSSIEGFTEDALTESLTDILWPVGLGPIETEADLKKHTRRAELFVAAVRRNPMARVDDVPETADQAAAAMAIDHALEFVFVDSSEEAKAA
jgi:hypothetical protein